MSIYDQIVNPKTGRKVNISGKIGKKLLTNYVHVLNKDQYGGDSVSKFKSLSKSTKSNPFAKSKIPSWKKKFKRALFKVKIINGWNKLVKEKLYEIDSKILNSIEEKFLAINKNPSKFIGNSVYDVFGNSELSWIRAISKNLSKGYTREEKLFNKNVKLINKVVNSGKNINKKVTNDIKKVLNKKAFKSIKNKIIIGKEFSNDLINLLDTPSNMTEMEAKKLSKIKVDIHNVLKPSSSEQKGGYYNFDQTGGGFMSFLTSGVTGAQKMFKSAHDCLVHQLSKRNPKLVNSVQSSISKISNTELKKIKVNSMIEAIKNPSKKNTKKAVNANKNFFKNVMSNDVIDEFDNVQKQNQYGGGTIGLIGTCLTFIGMVGMLFNPPMAGMVFMLGLFLECMDGETESCFLMVVWNFARPK